MSFSRKTIGHIVTTVLPPDTPDCWNFYLAPVLYESGRHYAHEVETIFKGHAPWIGLEAVDFSGLKWGYRDEPKVDYDNIGYEAVFAVWKFFIALYDAHPFQLRSLLTAPAYGSYGCKHVLERARRIIGDRSVRDGYVSNGEFIIGYAMFLKNFFGCDNAKIRKIIRPQIGVGGGPLINAWCRMPRTYNIIEEYARNARIGLR